MLLIDELLNVNFDKHCRDCPYRDNNDIWKRFNDYVDRIDFTNVISNDKISNDLETLQKHYTILLDFCYELMEKRMRDKELLDILNRRIKLYKEKIENGIRYKT